MAAGQYHRTRDAKACDNDDGHEEAAMQRPEFAHQISLSRRQP
jgi:hypothetical protein